ncbi:MAG: hypothetical protein J6P40_11325 [Oscillospiraceae bacterium]|nr:hypothetical protein [Oscillospiraceae bacterium]
MISLDKLPEVTKNVLSGLTADSSLKQKIYCAVTHNGRHISRFSKSQMIAFSCCLALVMGFALWGIHSGIGRTGSENVRYQTFSAATHTGSSPVFLQDFLSP